jgi:hypothetical protein
MATLEPNGAFRVDPLPVGTYALRVQAQGFRTRRIEDVAIRAGETTRLPPIEMDRGISVSGRVSAPSGADLREHVVWFRAPAHGGVRAPLAKDGSFRATGLEPGAWRPLIVPERWSGDRGVLVPLGEGTLTLREGDGEVRFDATWVHAGRIDLQIADARLPAWGSAAAPTAEQERFSSGCRVLLRTADGRVLFDGKGRVWSGYTDVGGWDWVPPGRYVARLETADGTARDRTVDVAEGATVRAFPAE